MGSASSPKQISLLCCSSFLSLIFKQTNTNTDTPPRIFPLLMDLRMSLLTLCLHTFTSSHTTPDLNIHILHTSQHSGPEGRRTNSTDLISKLFARFHLRKVWDEQLSKYCNLNPGPCTLHNQDNADLTDPTHHHKKSWPKQGGHEPPLSIFDCHWSLSF